MRLFEEGVYDGSLSERHVAWFAQTTYSTDKNDISYGDEYSRETESVAYVTALGARICHGHILFLSDRNPVKKTQ